MGPVARQRGEGRSIGRGRRRVADDAGAGVDVEKPCAAGHRAVDVGVQGIEGWLCRAVQAGIVLERDRQVTDRGVGQHREVEQARGLRVAVAGRLDKDRVVAGGGEGRQVHRERRGVRGRRGVRRLLVGEVSIVEDDRQVLGGVEAEGDGVGCQRQAAPARHVAIAVARARQGDVGIEEAAVGGVGVGHHAEREVLVGGRAHIGRQGRHGNVKRQMARPDTVLAGVAEPDELVFREMCAPVGERDRDRLVAAAHPRPAGDRLALVGDRCDRVVDRCHGEREVAGEREVGRIDGVGRPSPARGCLECVVSRCVQHSLGDVDRQLGAVGSISHQRRGNVVLSLDEKKGVAAEVAEAMRRIGGQEREVRGCVHGRR